jgi:predicted PurR-regulated permease PerM
MNDQPAMQHGQSLTSLVVLLAGIAIVLGAMHVGASFATPLLLAIVLALIFWPLYAWLRSRGLGTLPALMLLLAGLVVGAAVLALVVGSSISGLANRLAMYTDRLSAELQSLDDWFAIHGMSDVHLADVLSPATIEAAFTTLVGALIGAVYQGLLMLLLLVFFLFEGPVIVDRLRRSLDAGDPNPARLAAFGHDVSQYFVLRAAVNAVTGAGVTLVLWLLGVDFPLLWGVLTFFLSFIPYVGMFVASVPSVLLAWAEYDLTHAVVVALALTVVNATAENVVQPALMHKGLHLSPTFVLVSVFFWSWLLGAGGSFLAVPLSLGLLAVLANFPAARWFVDAASSPSTD